MGASSKDLTTSRVQVRDAVDMDYPTEFYEKYLDLDAFMADSLGAQDPNE